MNRKSNLRLSVSLIGSIVTACIFSVIVLATLTGILQHNAGVALVQVITLLVLYLFVYMRLWNVGEKDINYVQTGHIAFDCYSGLKIGLIGMTVLYLPVALLIIGMVQQNQMFIGIFRILSAVFFGFHSLFLPEKVQDFTVIHVLLTLLPPLVVPAISMLAYYLGNHRISLLAHLVYKKKK